MNAFYPTAIRFFSAGLSAFLLSGSVAFGHGEKGGDHDDGSRSEYEVLSQDPYEALIDKDFDRRRNDPDEGFSFDRSAVDYQSFDNGPGNTAIIVQKGDGNRVSAVQSGDDNLLVSVQQSTGGLNLAEIVQSGNDNASALLQYGEDNLYSLEQTGQNNWSEATQYGNRNTFEHVQNGDNLGFAITQYGESSIRVTQSGH